MDANARLIVKAFNAYDTLRAENARLRAALERIETATGAIIRSIAHVPGKTWCQAVTDAGIDDAPFAILQDAASLARAALDGAR